MGIHRTGSIPVSGTNFALYTSTKKCQADPECCQSPVACGAFCSCLLQSTFRTIRTSQRSKAGLDNAPAALAGSCASICTHKNTHGPAFQHWEQIVVCRQTAGWFWPVYREVLRLLPHVTECFLFWITQNKYLRC
jgi:hypothetical protein